MRLLSLLLVTFFAMSSLLLAVDPCRIDVVDAENGWPVPLVELRTTNNVRFVSDNAGRIAFDLPELMDQPVWFAVKGNGYEVPADGFNYRGVRLEPTPGGHLTIKVHRKLPAKRLGRLTGSGLFGESQKLGLETDWTDQRIVGCDSVQTAGHNGRLYWLWGDTTLAKYPLGLFHTLGATTSLTPLETFAPPVRLKYDYFEDGDALPKSVARMPGDGPTWLNGFVSLPDQSGTARLVATYTKIEPPLSAYEVGLCIWSEQTEQFEQHQVIWNRSERESRKPVVPEGHVTFWTDDAGIEWLLFGDPFPILQCRATFEAWEDPSQWKTLQPQKVVLSHDGKREVKPHRGSIGWNEYRQKWISIFTENGGESSFLGEIWYAEADRPFGPWGSAIQVVTHDNYTFYNPLIHAELTPVDSPVILFEGTYTAEFANHAEPTPKYNYNQILFRLDLDQLHGEK